MKRLFGNKKPVAPPPTLDETADRLGTRGDRLDEQIKKLDGQLAVYKEQLKKVRPGPAQEGIKRRALQVLKQKRLYESQRGTLYNQQFNMEQTRFTMDSVKDTVQTVQALTSASKEMKTLMKKNKELNLDYIDKLQDELYDMKDMTDEINEMMGRSYDVPEDIDETDLLAELDALEDDMLDAGASETPSYLEAPDLPAAPAGQTQRTEEELGLPAVAQKV